MGKREQIINAAIRLFVEQGFDNTPTSQISKEAGVATGTLFNYFSTKEELINEAYLYVKTNLFEMLSESCRSYISTKEAFEGVWFSLIEWGYNNRMESEFSRVFVNSVYITKLTKKRYEELGGPIRDLMARGFDEGLFKDVPVELLQNVIGGVYQGVMNYMYELDELDEKLVASSFDMLWDAISK
ncbi:TetR/AcrR family transcriptional regulator [Methanococcoides methylutens]|uniref:Transcriptional regulator, TetR family n=1 Tax=Methanococcoides methylutens MM1 TaxID=1434104 RepID=A0A0E3SS34_METMT|nr:TetR/AcrR family transcriptional regulator [Methanococcoides methylutens]AKB85248.1 Transcriptional regulator, TetR family [Methanococcoides methylutens MM1]